jgi:hypothetical protein
MSNNEITELQEVHRRRDNDGLHKRRDIWHYKLKVDGRWKEISTQTRSYQQARTIRLNALRALEDRASNYPRIPIGSNESDRSPSFGHSAKSACLSSQSET